MFCEKMIFLRIKRKKKMCKVVKVTGFAAKCVFYQIKRRRINKREKKKNRVSKIKKIKTSNSCLFRNTIFVIPKHIF